jgi:hypothetical protein
VKSAVGAYADANVGTAKPVTLSTGFTLSGNTNNNYVIDPRRECFSHEYIG